MNNSLLKKLVVPALVLMLGGWLLAEEVSSGFRNSKAKGATVRYERSLEKARSDYDRQIEAAQKEYIAALNSALDEVTRSGNLDEAVKIRNAKDALLNVSEADDKPREDDRLQVLGALYGVNQSWLDVTDKLQKAIGEKNGWSAVVSAEDWGDPAPGFGKTLIVRYAVKDRVLLKAEYDGRRFQLP